MNESRPPIHESLSILSFEEIYRTDDWWKAVVRYQFDENEACDEVAVYLWNKDDNWTRKNKYVIKTEESWITDREIVDELFDTSSTTDGQTEFPVSDYYTVDAGETVFRSDDWWNAILKIGAKGDYETEEVMIYLWQATDDGWRRRQKYTIKSETKWAEEVEAVESIIELGESSVEQESSDSVDSGSDVSSSTSDSVGTDIESLEREIDQHLSEQLRDA